MWRRLRLSLPAFISTPTWQLSRFLSVLCSRHPHDHHHSFPKHGAHIPTHVLQRTCHFSMSVPDIGIGWCGFKGVLILVLLLARVQQYNHVGDFLVWTLLTVWLLSLNLNTRVARSDYCFSFVKAPMQCIGYYTMHRHWGEKWARMTYSTCIHCLLDFFFSRIDFEVLILSCYFGNMMEANGGSINDRDYIRFCSKEKGSMLLLLLLCNRTMKWTAGKSRDILEQPIQAS